MAAWSQILQIVGNFTVFYLSFDTHDSPGSIFVWKSKFNIGFGNVGKIWLLCQMSLCGLVTNGTEFFRLHTEKRVDDRIYFKLFTKIGTSIFITDDEVLLKCSTVSGANPNAPCIFPFKFKNVTYHQCTKADNAEGDITPWCSTLIDDSGEHIGDAGNWGYCGPDCSLDASCKWTNVQIAYTLTFDIIKG